MFGTVAYYSEQLMTIVMNRLVINDAISLDDSYEKLQEEISTLNESETSKQVYYRNLTKAYEKVTNYIYGVDKEEELV
ncbi:hypothetical protein ACFSKI_00870 [Pseudogracilibacillus auburnensis]|uniref:Uncharacterized protein n=1 Tax=Pseudogracilibacillus auburnensis TaxID=1494959 RepID=A0A2V3VNZ8_9BACI|nr:hypothetical protein [Pseudogracilibacillus auburnensis]MBO1002577.1 hypothetical protein [Pseudogracilibacillus auburnensis]PXW82581.1 hypothetical protein DFR56_11717 [Pseudogracilibacillus auburnensis]